MPVRSHRAASIGIRQLKAELSRQLRRVEGGETLAVTDRGRVIAMISPAAREVEPGVEWARRLVAAGKATWAGGKPSGAKHPVRLKGGPMISETVIEDRG
jgi:antitoxin (DNA-binding transcriptional repressor) of toxin-antitoxin stability system